MQNPRNRSGSTSSKRSICSACQIPRWNHRPEQINQSTRQIRVVGWLVLVKKDAVPRIVIYSLCYNIWNYEFRIVCVLNVVVYVVKLHSRLDVGIWETLTHFNPVYYAIYKRSSCHYVCVRLHVELD